MFRRFFGLMLVLTLIAGTSVAIDRHRTGTSQMIAQTAPNPGDVADRGARACFGVGSNNCCNELVFLAAVAGMSGNIFAFGIAAFGAYAYC